VLACRLQAQFFEKKKTRKESKSFLQLLFFFSINLSALPPPGKSGGGAADKAGRGKRRSPSEKKPNLLKEYPFFLFFLSPNCFLKKPFLAYRAGGVGALLCEQMFSLFHAGRLQRDR